jgi:hypothetical protein
VRRQVKMSVSRSRGLLLLGLVSFGFLTFSAVAIGKSVPSGRTGSRPVPRVVRSSVRGADGHRNQVSAITETPKPLIGVSEPSISKLVRGVSARPTSSKSVPQLARFFLRGTNGYKVTVLASVEGADSPVRVVVEDHRGGAAYQVSGTVTPTEINASFGQLGDISLRFHPSGRVLHNHVYGDEECPHGAARLGEFIGVFSFRGEGDYTTVSARRIQGGVGAPTAPIDHQEELSLGCPDPDRRSYIVPPGQVPGSVHENPPGSEELSAVAATPDESIAFGAVSFSLRDPESPGAKPDSCLFVALAEEVREPVQIARVVFGGGPASECPLAESPDPVTVTPPSPFSGTATLQRNPDGSADWAGSLSVPMLGRGTVALAGPAFTAELSK